MKQVDRIEKQALDAWRSELSNWTQPASFRSRVDEICLAIPRKVFFRQAGLTFLRDAWIASRVADALSSESVRLVSSERPDFEIRNAGEVDGFEATEADMGERRRGTEPDTLCPQPDPVENWRKRFEGIPTALNRVIAKKLRKDYPPHVSLVVYVNLGCYGAFVREGLPVLRQGTSLAKDKFRRVFALWEGALYKFWQDRQGVFEERHFMRADDF